MNQLFYTRGTVQVSVIVYTVQDPIMIFSVHETMNTTLIELDLYRLERFENCNCFCNVFVKVPVSS